jgi:hypothetical protein
MDVKEISQKIFTLKPKDAHSIKIEFPDNTELKECFEILLSIFTEGMKILHGDEKGKVDLNQLTEDDFFKFKQYFHSFGFECIYKIFDYQESIDDDIDFNAMKYTNIQITKSTQLEDLCLPLLIGKMVYVIYFSHYMPEKTTI